MDRNRYDYYMSEKHNRDILLQNTMSQDAYLIFVQGNNDYTVYKIYFRPYLVNGMHFQKVDAWDSNEAIPVFLVNQDSMALMHFVEKYFRLADFVMLLLLDVENNQWSLLDELSGNETAFKQSDDIYKLIIRINEKEKEITISSPVFPLEKNVALKMHTNEAEIELTLRNESKNLEITRDFCSINKERAEKITADQTIMKIDWCREEGVEKLSLNFSNYVSEHSSSSRTTDTALPESECSLYLIFDRTTPDFDKWLEARDILSNAFSGEMEGSGVTHREEFPAELEAMPDETGSVLDASSLNIQFRTLVSDSVVKVFKEAQESFTVQLFWFAEHIEEGFFAGSNNLMRLSDGLYNPAFTGKTSRIALNQDISALFGDLGYCPGIDVFDPVEEALRMALTDIEHEDSVNPIILIIGNSVPNFDHDDEPLLELLKNDKRVLSNIRRRSLIWKDSLNVVRDQEIPLCYLYVDFSNFPDTLNSTADASVLRNHFRQFQQKIMKQLSASINVHGQDMASFKTCTCDKEAFTESLSASRDWLLQKMNQAKQGVDLELL